ncbi:MAG: transposase [Methylococcales bacterium]|nr:transposase [Methylococcales bacterium]
MARLSRIVIPNLPLHIMHRGNNRQNIFESEEDMVRIKGDIALSLSKTGCYLHAYVIMTNHLHLLITPEDKEQLTKFMQSLANRYVRYFNAKYKRTGTIWEGRFKSCLVDSDEYLFTLCKYIEMNPVKAGMVKDIADYKWSSYPYNALDKEDNLITEHKLYEDLGLTTKQRNRRYKEIFDSLDIEKQESRISSATMRGEVYGSDVYHNKIGKLISRPTRVASHGGDRKSEKYNNQVDPLIL